MNRDFFFSCNKKIYIDQRNKTIIKGFSTGFSFNYFSNLLFYLLQDHKEFFINFINNEESRKNLYNILWETFSSQLQDLKKNKTIELFIKNETINKIKMLLFFSKRPDHYASVPTSKKRILGSYLISIIDFKDKISKKQLIDFIVENLDYSSYWLYILRQFKSLYLFNIKNKKTEENVFSLSNIENDFFKNSSAEYFSFFTNNRTMVINFEVLLKKGFILFLKIEIKNLLLKSI